MNDYIVKLNNIKIKAIHGVNEIEKVKQQLFEVDVAVCFSKSTCNDDIGQSIDYEYIHDIIERVFEDDCVNLLETLGERIIDLIYMTNDVKNVIVTIRKPEIKFNHNSNCAEVSISRSNE